MSIKQLNICSLCTLTLNTFTIMSVHDGLLKTIGEWLDIDIYIKMLMVGEFFVA